MTVIPVGIDIGRSGVKVFTEGVRKLLPSGLAFGWPEGVEGEITDTIRIETGGRRFFLSDAPGSVFELTERKVSESTALTLLAACTWVMHRTACGSLYVITGVPAMVADTDARALTNTIAKVLSRGVTFYVDDGVYTLRENFPISVVCEGDGLFYDYIVSQDTVPESSAIVDIGHITTNIITYEGKKRRDRFTISVGGNDVYDRLMTELPNRYGVPIPDYSVVRRIIRSIEEDRPIHIRGGPSPEELRSLVTTIAAEVWEETVLPRIRNFTRRGGVFFADVLVLGGGGARLFPVETLEQGAFIPSDPRFAQARGYYQIAKRLLKQREARVVEEGEIGTVR